MTKSAICYSKIVYCKKNCTPLLYCNRQLLLFNSDNCRKERIYFNLDKNFVKRKRNKFMKGGVDKKPKDKYQLLIQTE